MIDENGNKIGEEKSSDSDFAMAELRYLMKSFRNERDDSKPAVIISALNEFLNLYGESDLIIEILQELEEYSYESENNDFLWGLVYARRSISESFQKEGNLKDAAVSRHVGARHFEKICKIRPSYYNSCCRIIEYAMAAKLYKDCEGQEIGTGRIFVYAEALFSKLNESTEKIYFSAGQTLFLNKYLYLMKIKAEEKERFQAIKRLVEYSRRLYLLEEQPWDLKMLMMSYLDYTRFKGYSVSPEEEENIRNLIVWGEEALSRGNSEIEKYLEKLRVRLRILYGE